MPHTDRRFAAAFALAGVFALAFPAVRAAAAAPDMMMRGGPQAYPLYCHGGGTMKTEILDDGGTVTVDTSFTWASSGAGAAAPAAGACAWADRAPRDVEIRNGGNYLCDRGPSRFHAIFGAGRATENSNENAPLAMAPIVVELPTPQFRYIPSIVTDDAYFEFAVYRDPSQGNCMHVTRYLGIVRPPFSALPTFGG